MPSKDAKLRADCPAMNDGPESKSLLIHYVELARLHKFPLGSLLIFWPSAWGLAMAAYKSTLSPQSLALDTITFLVGSTLLHSAACVLNDICDKDFDAQVERTKHRPLVTGMISVPSASVFLMVLLLLSGSMLLLTNRTAAYCGLIGIFPFHALYPFMKRWTYWPQAWLGFAMNWGLPVAWIHVTGTVDIRTLGLLIAGTVCWTIVYDTMYACQDRQDDIKAGIKSTAVLFGPWVRPLLVGFATIFVASLTLAGYLDNHGPAYFVITCAGSAIHFLMQFATWNVSNPKEGGVKFKENHNIGYVIWTGMLVDYWLKVVAAHT